MQSIVLIGHSFDTDKPLNITIDKPQCNYIEIDIQDIDDMNTVSIENCVADSDIIISNIKVSYINPDLVLGDVSLIYGCEVYDEKDKVVFFNQCKSFKSNYARLCNTC